MAYCKERSNVIRQEWNSLVKFIWYIDYHIGTTYDCLVSLYSLETIYNFRLSCLKRAWCVVNREEASNQVVSIKIEFRCLAGIRGETLVEKRENKDGEASQVHFAFTKELQRRTVKDFDIMIWLKLWFKLYHDLYCIYLPYICIYMFNASLNTNKSSSQPKPLHASSERKIRGEIYFCRHDIAQWLRVFKVYLFLGTAALLLMPHWCPMIGQY